MATYMKTALFRGYAGTGIPQLTVLDRNGKVLADNFNAGRYTDPAQTLEALAKLLETTPAK